MGYSGMGGYSVGDFGEDPGDNEPQVTTLASTEQTARKRHHCDACETSIFPGERYQKDVWIEDGGLVVRKHHSDSEHCRRCRAAYESAREAHYSRPDDLPTDDQPRPDLNMDDLPF